MTTLWVAVVIGLVVYWVSRIYRHRLNMNQKQQVQQERDKELVWVCTKCGHQMTAQSYYRTSLTICLSCGCGLTDYEPMKRGCIEYAL